MRLRRLGRVVLGAGLAVAVPGAGAADAATTLQPGALHRTSSGQCTMNFVYDGLGTNAGKTYVGTAAHCVSQIGQFAYDIDDERFGRVAFIGDAEFTVRDYAFIEVFASDVARVSPAMKGHPAYPTGVTDVATATPGDLVQFSGYPLGYAWTQPTQEQRRGILGSTGPPLRPEGTWGAVGPVHWGDSGGPVAHIPTGTALGINSRLCVPGTCSVSGPTVAEIVGDAGAANFPVALRTVGDGS